MVLYLLNLAKVFHFLLDLIIIDVPVYGLDEAPASWRLTVTTFLIETLQFQRNLLSLLAIKRRLRPPTLDERADILHNVYLP